MFEVFKDAIASWTTTLLNSADGAIGAMCDLVYGPIFVVIAGLVIGWYLIKALFEDDLVGGASKIFIAIIPLLIVAWLLKPVGGSCKLVAFKNDVLSVQTAMIKAVTGGNGGFLGTSGPDMLGKVVDQTSSVFTNFFEQILDRIKARGKESATGN